MIIQQQGTQAITPQRLLFGLALMPLALVAYQHVLVTGWGLPGLPLTEPGVAMFVALFSFIHSLYSLGWRNTLALFGITVAVSWNLEQVGAATGLIYGAYHYSDQLGPKLGHVPYAIPVSWYSMLYLSYVIAMLITQGLAQRPQSSRPALLWQAFVSGVVLTAWDVLVDPLASAPNVRAWVWEHGGPFYGVPMQNFAGWILTGFTVVVCYRLYERRFPARPLGQPTRLAVALPLVVYGLVMLQMMLRHDAPTEWPILAAFVMGFPLVAACSQLLKKPCGAE